MSLFIQISEECKQALLSREALKLSVLRMLLSELNYKKIDIQRELTDEDIISVIRKEVKKRQEAIESYIAGGRKDQAEQEAQEKVILEKYLPTLMSEDEIKKQIAEIKEISGLTDFGQIMRIVSPVFKGKADGSLVAKLVREWMELK